MTLGIPCMLMRGGTSKGAYFLAEDLPADAAARDDLLLRVMGSPDPRQIDGIGGGHPLTSKVAVVSPSADPEADLDYLFLQVQVTEPRVSDRQTCGNLLAGVAPFALERGIVPIDGDTTRVRIRIRNGGGLATATVDTRDGAVRYAGDTLISGAPFPAAPITLDFAGTEGSTCGALLPTGEVRDVVAGVPVTCVDNGMPVVVVAAAALGATGYEEPAALEADEKLTRKVEEIRLAAGELMGLGDVGTTTVPKVSLVAAPRDGGTLCTRTFIPHRVHASIGVLGAVSVATAVLLDGSVAAEAAGPVPSGGPLRIEHPTGFFDTSVEVTGSGTDLRVLRSGVVRTARKLFDGAVWPRRPQA
ncbi:4-oxalomesaconate tautomerase [Actinocorallia herbida]|uniref:4-oxalomesaconate tautomerase n=1 Tax=Actinocorallia herbida TaxID=58109 RepID=A0A3N1CWW7_9ACTN|nr:4-oxalomesaconate tautomerase [Actinocorallia herbida]ROO85208.1 4-oxalomesaconate tautomerase [Actinocorallia herbida]